MCSVLTGLLIIFTAPLVRAQDPLSRSTHEAQEPHLQNVKQLTFGGQNAEAYFSYDGSKIIFQSTRPPYQCDQIFSMNVDGSDVKLLNSGKGLTTCGFFFPDGNRMIMPQPIWLATPARQGWIEAKVTLADLSLI